MSDEIKSWTVRLPISCREKIYGLAQVKGLGITQNDVLRAMIELADEDRVRTKILAEAPERKKRKISLRN